MGRQYSAKTFLRNVPNDLLQQYFQKQDIDLGLDWGRLDETEVNPIFVALEALPAATRSQIDTDFALIHEMACEDGVQAIMEEGRNWGCDWAEPFAGMRNHYERAFWAFLNEPHRFHVAGCFHEMDRLGGIVGNHETAGRGWFTVPLVPWHEREAGPSARRLSRPWA